MAIGTSFLRTILYRELDGLAVRKRPYNVMETNITEIETINVEHRGEGTPPLAISLCKNSRNVNVLALADEAGYVSLLETPTGPVASKQYNSDRLDKRKLSEWVAHQNAIFDMCWLKEDRNLLTSSGDQTIKLWDTQEKKCTAIMTGHKGSVKSLSPHPNNHDILVSGSRDGSFALWDVRKNNASGGCSGQQTICATSVVQRAHVSALSKRARSGKGSSPSITSVLYLKDEISVATAGAVDSIVKFWDTRYLKTPINQVSPYSSCSNPRERRSHGVSSLSQDSSGMFLTAACMDSKIYLYNILSLSKGPIQSFSGGRIDSFFVKSAISPDADHILSGSSDGNVYIWHVKNADMPPIVTEGHSGEVTSVDWCTYDIGKLATCSDDFTVKIWNMQNKWCGDAKERFGKKRRKDSEEIIGSPSNRYLSPMSELTTPNSKDNTCVDPEASPSSVLNPPSSLKRKTIRDYFVS